MRINLTLLVQVINFSITYWFLNRFMFRPVIEFLNQKKTKEEKTKKRLEKKEQDLLCMEKKKHQDLGDFKVKMKKEYGIVPPKTAQVPSELHIEINKKEIEKLTDIAKKILVKRVPYVD